MKIYLSVILFFIFQSQIFSQHNWTRTNPGGGGTIAMVGATANGTIVSASDLSGIYTSTNNGASWNVFGALQGLTETHISSLGFHPQDGNTFIIGTGLGVFKTVDGGQTITKSQVELHPNNGIGYIESIGMAMSNNFIGYLAHYEDWLPEFTFMKTTDAGSSWTIVNTTGIPSDARVVKILVDQNNANIVYALTGKARFGCTAPNLYRSINGGQNWTRIGKVNGLFPQILDFDLHPTDANIIFMTTFQMNPNGCNATLDNYITDTGAFYKSTNGGISFEKISDQNGIDHGGIISVGTNPLHISLTEIINTDANDDNSGTWKTTDGGITWQHTGFIQNWNIECAHPSYAFVSSFNGYAKTLTKDRFNPDRLYGAFGQWSWSTTDGGNHINNISCKEITNNHFLSTGLDNINGNWLDINDANPSTIYMGAYDIGFWYSKNHGNSWKRSYPSITTYPEYSWWAGGGTNCNFVISDPVRENVVWAAFSADQPDTKSAVFKSIEFGENWSISNTGLKPLGTTTHGISIDVNSPVNNRTLYLTQEGDVYKSVNDGANWTKILINGGLKFTEVDKKNGQLVYAGGENGLWRSTDGGASWNEVGLIEMRFNTTVSGALMRPDIIPTYDDLEVTPPIVAWQGVFDIATDPNIENRVYVVAYGTHKGLYRSDNAGESWIKLYTNDYMRGITISPANSNIIYASSSLSYHSGDYNENSLGILVSYDAGINWTSANGSMAWSNGGRMEIETGTAPHIWAWSSGTGVQYAPIPNFTLGIHETPTENMTIKVFPNPSNNILFINLTKITKDATAIIYTSTGKIVKKLKLSHSTINKVNLHHFSQGIYFIKISTHSFYKTLKFIKK